MIPFRKSLAFRLLAISLIVLALPLLVDSFIIVQNRYQHAIEDAKGNLLEISRVRELPLSHVQPLRRPLLLVFEHILKLKKNFPQKPSEEINKKLSTFADAGDFSGVYLLDITKDDRYIVVGSNVPKFLGRDYTSFIELSDIYSPQDYERGYFSYITYSSDDLQPYFIVGRVVYSEKEGEPTGVIVVTKNVSDQIDRLLIPDTDDYTINFSLLLPSTISIASSDKSLEFNYFEPISEYRKNLIVETEPLAKLLLAKEPIAVSYSIGYPFFEFYWKGETQIAYMKKIKNSDFFLLTYAAREEIFSEPLINFLNVYGTYGIILLIGATLAFMGTYRMARGMRNLTRVMEGMQKGDLSLRYASDHLGFEINHLGSIFNEMIDTLLQKQALAEEQRIARETYAKELAIGREVQRSLLIEKIPPYEGVDLAEIYIPAKEVGGDFYDVLVREKKEGKTLFLVVADASGKGVSACFYSLGVRSSLRAYAQKYDEVSRIVEKTNHLFIQDTGDTGMFITAIIGSYDAKTKELTYTSAGHNPALIRRANGSVEVLASPGIAMGLLEYDELAMGKLTLRKGDVLVFYTDGVTEAHNESFEEYSEKRLIAFLEKQEGESAKQIASDLVEDVMNFAGSAPQHDDITLLVMRIES